MAMKVPLSFKKTEKDMYDFLISQLSPSIYIKQLILNEMQKQQPIKEHVKHDIFNF